MSARNKSAWPFGGLGDALREPQGPIFPKIQVLSRQSRERKKEMKGLSWAPERSRRVDLNLKECVHA